MSSTAEQILAVLAARVDNLPPTVDERTPLTELDVDSLTLLEVTFDLENRFPGLDGDRAAAAVTVGDLIVAVESGAG